MLKVDRWHSFGCCDPTPSSLRRQEMHQDEVKGNKKTNEKAEALEKMQAEMLTLDVSGPAFQHVGWIYIYI